MPGGIVSTAAAARSKKELNIFGLTRETFQRWRRDLRPARLAGLFLFEFVVVLLGVLAAQWVADWAEDRRLTREAEVQFAQARDAGIRLAQVADYWSKVSPCMVDRAAQIARLAAAGGTMSAAEIGRPALPTGQMPTWDEAVRRAAYARFGDEKMGVIANLEVGVEITMDTSRLIRDGWSTFALLDPANGTPTDADRANVRLAAIRVMDYVRLMRANGVAEEMEILGVPADQWHVGELEPLGVDRCGMLLDWQK